MNHFQGVELAGLQRELQEFSVHFDGFVPVAELLAITESKPDADLSVALAAARLLDPNMARLLDSPLSSSDTFSGSRTTGGSRNLNQVSSSSVGSSAETLPKNTVFSALDTIRIGNRRWIKFEHPTFDWQAWVVSENGTFGATNQTAMRNDKSASSTVLEEILEGDGVVMVSAGERHSAALSEHGRLYTWGCGSDGRLGLGNEDHALSPQLVEFVQIPCAHSATVVESADLIQWLQTNCEVDFLKRVGLVCATAYTQARNLCLTDWPCFTGQGAAIRCSCSTWNRKGSANH